MARLELDRVDVRLGGRQVLHDLSLTVEDGECLALLGPSGCGKTTTLRAVAGFLRPERGDVRVNGVSIAKAPPNKRNVGIVFQDYALFPHMNVAENVAYGLRMRGVARAEAGRRVAEALDLVRLGDFGPRYPEEMSGGQRQRVALARALVIRPDILLLDEPLGALDRKLRDAMQVELKQLQRSVGITTIIVTHDQEEALSLSDRLAVMFEGRLEALGPPADLYEAPGSLRVMEFLGAVNLIEGEVDGAGPAPLLRAGALSLTLDRIGGGGGSGEGGRLRVGIRPEHVAVSAADPDAAPRPDALTCRIEEIVFKGAAVDVLAVAPDRRRYHASAPASRIAAAGLRRGDLVQLDFPSRHLMRVGAP